jgi:hypothetical protein
VVNSGNSEFSGERRQWVGERTRYRGSALRAGRAVRRGCGVIR